MVPSERVPSRFAPGWMSLWNNLGAHGEVFFVGTGRSDSAGNPVEYVLLTSREGKVYMMRRERIDRGQEWS